LSDNEITEVHLQIDKWQKMEILNVSSNKLTSLPASLSKLPNVRALYLNGNKESGN
jgi:Leucine-rich repeat (LRR) protein